MSTSSPQNNFHTILQPLEDPFIFQSIWRDYDSLSSIKDQQVINACLEGYDITKDALKDIFTDWDQRISTPSSVTLAPCAQYSHRAIENALSSVLSNLDFESKIAHAKSIFIKLALVQANKWRKHATSTPIFITILIDYLFNINRSLEIFIGDASGHERDSRFLIDTCGIAPILKQNKKVHYIDLNVEDLVLVDVPEPLTLRQLLIPNTIAQADIVISVSKLKTHKWTGVSLGMKNMFGVLPGSVYGYPKNVLHWSSIPRVICDICSAIPPDLAIIDGIMGIEGSGPLNGEVTRSGILIGGCDPLATDVLGTQIMGISPKLIPMFWFATLKNLGNPSIKHLENQIAANTSVFLPPPNQYWLYDTVGIDNQGLLSIIEKHLVNVSPILP